MKILDPAYLVLSLWVLDWVHSEMGVETGPCSDQVSFDLMHIIFDTAQCSRWHCFSVQIANLILV